MTPTQAIKEIDTVIEQIISKTEKDKAEKLKKAYEIVKQDYQDKINLSVIRTDHSLYLQENDKCNMISEGQIQEIFITPD